jgi:plasmid stabilization system protein ParE
MSKDFKALWAENAIEDLLAIKEYISEDSPDRAEAWILELFTFSIFATSTKIVI